MSFNMSLYKPSYLEIKIEQCYRNHGILSPTDLTIANVSYAFDVQLEYYDGKPFADWTGSSGIVVLNQSDNLLKQRVDFFHEVGHCVLHVGDQRTLPGLFIDLQEFQSLRFQYYAALPYFMIAEIVHDSYDGLIQSLSESFSLPVHFVQKRINQVLNRIQQERTDIALKTKLAPKVLAYRDYRDETKRILNQLHQQIKKKKGGYRIGY